MSILMESSESIIKVVKENISLFKSFEHVYLFGSVLDFDAIHNDIDLLIIYKEYSNIINSDLQLISAVLEKATGMLIDITSLSIEEEKDTAFLDRIKPRYLKIK